MTTAVVNDLRERRVLVSASGSSGDVLKTWPPLVFNQADADRFLGTFAETVDAILR